jgi:hypothetical protein
VMIRDKNHYLIPWYNLDGRMGILKEIGDYLYKFSLRVPYRPGDTFLGKFLEIPMTENDIVNYLYSPKLDTNNKLIKLCLPCINI